MSNRLKGYILFSIVGLAIGYVLATEYLSWVYSVAVGYLFILRNVVEIFSFEVIHYQITVMILGASTLLGAAFAQRFVTEKLTTYGTTDWQSIKDMQRGQYFQAPGAGFLVAKTSPPEKKGKFISSVHHHHCLVIAPTGRGKGRGFVIPNLLSFNGSTVTLDVKAQNYDNTARLRKKAGDKVFRFAPLDYEVESASFNPLMRISKINDPGEQMLAMEAVSHSFLVTSNERNQSLLEGGREAFVAAGMLAIEMGEPTIGKIYDLVNTGQGTYAQRFAAHAMASNNPETRKLWESVIGNDPESLANMISIMNTAGLGVWKHRRIRELTSRSDFDFADIRRDPHSIYFTVTSAQLDQIPGLVRLFFTELVKTLEARLPEEDEPFHVMMILDEFHKLGKMTQLTDAITTLRDFHGKIAIVTQTVPKLIEIYGENEYRSIEGGCGIKFYMTPSDRRTAEEMSDAIGMTTKRSINKANDDGFVASKTISERTEEAPLLTIDDAMRMSKEEVVLVLDGEAPIRAHNIQYYADPFFRARIALQDDVSWDDVQAIKPQQVTQEPEENVAENTRTIRAINATVTDIREAIRERPQTGGTVEPSASVGSPLAKSKSERTTRKKNKSKTLSMRKVAIAELT